MHKIFDVIGLVAIGTILAVSAVGMTGALDEKPLVVACVSCVGGVGR